MNKIVSTDFITDDVQRLVPVDATATTPKNAAVAKLMKAWEAKTTQRTAKGAGLTLMAVSLAACNDDSTTTTATPTTPTTPVTPAGQTFTLTTRSDEFTGDAGDDTFDATTAGELNSSDDLTGGAGTDTLDATIATVVAPTLAGIESLIIQSTADAADIDLAGADTSITSITVTTSATDLDILNMQNNATFTLIDVTSAATGLTLDFDDDALGTDEAALVINTDGSTVAIDTVVGGQDDITTITFNATGSDSAITMDLTDITSVTFTGSADLSLLVAGNGFTEITSITGTAATGGLTIDLDDNAAAYAINLGSGDDSIVADQANTGTGGRTISLGAGDDTLNLGSNGSESDDVFTGGAGTDTLVIDDASDITAALTAGVSGFERLNGSEAATYDMSAFSDDSDFTIVRATAAGTDIVFDEVRDAVGTLELSGNSDNVTVSRLVDGTASAIIIATVAATTIDQEVIVDEEETVTINSADGALTMTTGLSADDMTSLVVLGDNAVDISAVSSTLLRTVDLSGLDDANFTAEFTAATNIVTVTANTTTGNSGAYNIQLGQSDDVAVGTVNADTFDGNGGDDTFTLGAGADTVIIDAQGADTITDFVVGASGDIISIDISALGAVIGGDGDNEADGVTVSIELVTGQETLAAGDNVIVLSGTTFASAALAGAALEAGGSRQITFTNATTAADDIVFVYSDGTDAFVVSGNIASAATTITAANLTETVLLTLEGVSHTDLADLTSANFLLA